MITKKQVRDNLATVRQFIAELENDVEWVEINYDNCPTLKKYNVKPFRIMKKKMRNSDGKVWNNINFFDAKKEVEKWGYRLPDIREMLALLEQYKTDNKNINYNNRSYLGIEELSYQEDVAYEWVEGAGCTWTRGGFWTAGAGAGTFALSLNNAPSYTGAGLGFRMVSDIKGENNERTKL